MAAGTDTSSLTLAWACEYLASQSPDELDQGDTDGLLEQVHRLARVVPLALPHIVRGDFVLSDYDIPRDTLLIYNLYAVHRAQLAQQSGSANQAIPFSLGRFRVWILPFSESIPLVLEEVT